MTDKLTIEEVVYEAQYQHRHRVHCCTSLVHHITKDVTTALEENRVKGFGATDALWRVANAAKELRDTARGRGPGSFERYEAAVREHIAALEAIGLGEKEPTDER